MTFEVKQDSDRFRIPQFFFADFKQEGVDTTIGLEGHVIPPDEKADFRRTPIFLDWQQPLAFQQRRHRGNHSIHATPPDIS